jgi:uncharacterized protein (TIGR02391 family)
MRISLHSLIPDPKALLELEPEELAGVILEYLNSLPEDSRGQLNRYNFSLSQTVEDYPTEYRKDISRALMEAWTFLEKEGMIAQEPGQDGNWIFITRRGKKVKNSKGLEAYRKSNILPKRMLHPKISQKVWATFLRGDYDTAVFQAFKEVEVKVRQAGNLRDEDIGTDLMRKAFHTTNGPLTDTNLQRAERDALAHLFAGAIGSYKNPNSHRQVSIDAEEAVEMIILASHLLKIVDSRSNI